MQHKLDGRLDMDRCGELVQPLVGMLDPSAVLELDLSGIEGADSAALALILELQRAARQRSASLLLQHFPTELESLARLYGIDGLLPLSGDNA